jgi:hypothetical protein
VDQVLPPLSPGVPDWKTRQCTVRHTPRCLHQAWLPNT